MNNTKFYITEDDLPVDYNLLGEYPPNIDTMNEKEVLDYFIKSYSITFSGGIFSYCDDVEGVIEHIKMMVNNNMLEYNTRTNKEKWCILFLIIFDLVFKMHNTYLAQEVLEEVTDNFDYYTNDERLKLIHDLNFSLYFGIEECIVINPSMIKELNASDEDILILEDLINNKNQIISILKKHIKKKDIDEEKFYEVFKIKVTKSLYEDMYDRLISICIDMMSVMETTLNLGKEKINNETWEEICNEVFAILTTMFIMTLKDEYKTLNVGKDLYLLITEMYRKKLKLKYKTLEIDF